MGAPRWKKKRSRRRRAATTINRLASSFLELSQVADLVQRGSISWCTEKNIYNTNQEYNNNNMSSTSSILLISTVLFLTTIEAAPQDLGSPIRIAQCRALCLDKVQTKFFFYISNFRKDTFWLLQSVRVLPRRKFLYVSFRYPILIWKEPHFLSSVGWSAS